MFWFTLLGVSNAAVMYQNILCISEEILGAERVCSGFGIGCRGWKPMMKQRKIRAFLLDELEYFPFFSGTNNPVSIE